MNPMFVVIVIGVAILIWWSLGGIFPFERSVLIGGGRHCISQDQLEGNKLW